MEDIIISTYVNEIKKIMKNHKNVIFNRAVYVPEDDKIIVGVNFMGKNYDVIYNDFALNIVESGHAISLDNFIAYVENSFVSQITDYMLQHFNEMKPEPITKEMITDLFETSDTKEPAN